MAGKGGSKKRRDQNATVPGRRTRKQIGVEKRADTEAVGRMRRIPGPLEKLRSREVAEMLADDALKGEMKQMFFAAATLGLPEIAVVISSS
jgi:hypothetical protein